MNIYEFKIKERNGNVKDLSEFKGKVMLIVNTATHWGLKYQYADLQNLYEKYNEKGFEILDFPCNQFKNQAPGTNEEIYNFVKEKYDITFQQFAKIEVNGENEHPLYTYLKSKKKGLLSPNIKWNFTKFLVDKNGNVVKRYGPKTEPKTFENDIIKLLYK